MSICQYHLRGNCRYGDRCRLSHVNPHEQQNDRQHRFRPPRAVINPDYNYVASSTAGRNHNVENSTTSAKHNSTNSPLFIWITENFANKKKALDIIQQMRIEARVWLKSSLWRFTSRSLFPGGHPLENSFADWNDQSFEEIRWAYRDLTSRNQEHIYKKAYSEYWENTQRQLLNVSKLDIDTIKSLKVYIDEYIASNHQPSKTLLSDIDMKDDNDNITSNSDLQSTNYTPYDLLLDDERAAFESETFELGQIPVHAPSRQFC